MIEELKAKRIKVGIITDGRPEGQRNKLEALGLDVDDVIVTDELGGIQFRKPCDIAFRIMMARWRLNPADIVYVETIQEGFSGSAATWHEKLMV